MLDTSGFSGLRLRWRGRLSRRWAAVGGTGRDRPLPAGRHLRRFAPEGAHYSPPIPEAIYGVGVQTLVRLPKETITAKADLVISGVESTTIEVHDFFPVFYFERGWVGRRLDVIAALDMQSADLEKPFPRVERLVYRHFMTGKTIGRKRVRPAWLVFALDMARRGIQPGIFTPQFSSGDLSPCRGCRARAREICEPFSGDIPEWFLPGEVDYTRSDNY
jgi:hypothetical protein